MKYRLPIFSRVLVGVVFFYAGAVKLFDAVSFSESIMNYHLVTPPVALIAASVLPAIEVLVGLCLIFGVMRRGSIIISCCLCLVFIAALMSLVVRGINIDCGCFSTSGGSLSTPLYGVGKNIFLIGLSMLAWTNTAVRNEWLTVFERVRQKKGKQSSESFSVLP